MENKELISIVIPVYKVEQYLRECVDSIINQTYRNLEIILVDDGSPDNCPKICEEYKEKDNRVKVIHKENGGLSSARNVGMSVANGDYIGFVDSDDYCDLCMYEKLYDNAIKYDADISICGYYDVFETFTSTKYLANETLEFDKDTALDLLFDDRTFHNYAWNKLYKKKTLEGVLFPDGMTFEDIATEHEIFAKADKFVYAVTPYYYYRRRSNSITQDFNPKTIRDFNRAICIREKSDEAIGREHLIDGNRLSLCVDIKKNRGKIKKEWKNEMESIYNSTFGKINFWRLSFVRKCGYLVIKYVPFMVNIFLNIKRSLNIHV